MQELFHTRKNANEGVELPLYLPNGEASEHTITVRGVDSDAFRKAEAAAKRKAVELAQIKSEQKRAEAVRETELECIAALVAKWTFEEPCTKANVVKFLREAPQIADMVNRFAARRAEFFAKKSLSSAVGQKAKSNSKKSQKGQKQNSETT